MIRVERMPRRARVDLHGAAIVLGILAFAGCTRGGDSDPELMVFAASSLTDAFAECEAAFEETHPGFDVIISTAGSQSLRLQIEQGADADVFASANPAHVDSLVTDGLVVSSLAFVANALVIAVPDDNPAAISTVADLGQAERLVVGSAEVPIGRYTQEFLERADAAIGGGFASRVRESVVSEEGNVRLVIGKVEIGEADAAIVYRTDAASRSRVSIIEIPEAMSPRAEYRIGVVTESSQIEMAEAWVEFVTTGPGQTILTSHGFLVP
jgi:molybdate transport system substrate-binding protein